MHCIIRIFQKEFILIIKNNKKGLNMKPTSSDLLKVMNFNKKTIDCMLSEREYQEKIWNENTTSSGGNHSHMEFFVFIKDYLDEAIHILSRNREPEASDKASHNMRKIAAMSLASLEKNKNINTQIILPKRLYANTMNELAFIINTILNSAMSFHSLSSGLVDSGHYHVMILKTICGTFEKLDIYPMREV